MALQVGHAEILLTLQDTALKRELKAAERQVLSTVKKIDAMRGEAEIGLDIDEVTRKRAYLEKVMQGWERRRAEATADVDTKRADAQIAKLRAQLAALDRQKVTLDIELAERSNLQRRLESLVSTTGRIKDSADEAETALGRFARNISQMTLRLGPFTASLRQWGIAMTALGPIIAHVTGALLAMTGAIATGMLGALTLGAAALTGMALAGTGLAFVIKPLKEDFKDITTAQNAYRNAVLRHGKASEQAQTKQKQLNQTLKGVRPAAREGFLALQTMRESWEKLSAPAREALINTLGQGLKTMDVLMPQFARRTNETAGIVSRAMNEMFAGLRSRGGRQTLDTIMGNFNAALRSALPALNQLGAAFGKVMAVASGLLPESARNFLEWATGVNEAASNTAELEQRVRRLGEAASATGRFFMSAFRLIGAVFGAGTGTGIDMLNSLAASMDRLTASVRAGALTNFFEEAADGSRKLWGALRPVLSAFGSFVAIATPFSNTLLTILAPLNNFIAAMLKLQGVRQIIQGIGFALAGAFVVSKIVGATTAILGLAGALRALGAAGAMTAAGRGAAGLLGLGTAAPAIAGVGAAAAPLGAALLAIVGGAAAAGGALLILSGRADSASEAIGAANDAARESQEAFKSLDGTYSGVANAASVAEQAEREYSRAKREVNRLTREGKRGTDEYKSAVLDMLNAEDTMKGAAQSQVEALRKRESAIFKLVSSTRKSLETLREERQQLQESLRGQGRIGRSVTEMADTKQKLARVNARLGVAERAYSNALAQSLLQNVNTQRALRQLPPLADRAARSLQNIARNANQRVAARIGIQVDTAGQAEKISRLTEQANRLGARRQVIRILANSQNADQAIRRLQRLVIREKRFAVRADAQRAQSSVQRLEAMRIKNKDFSINAQDNATSVIGSVIGMLASIPRSVTSVINVVRRGVGGVLGALGIGDASGKFPGERRPKASLVGEGRGPEALVNTQTGEAAMVHGPTLVSLKPEHAVIPTEPAFRIQGRAILMDVARELGIPGFQKGKKPKGKKSKKKLPVPERYRFAGVPLAPLENEVQNLSQQIQDRKRDKKALGNLPGRLSRARANLSALRVANARIEKLGLMADGFASQMQNASNKDDRETWRVAKRSRVSTLRQLSKWLRRAYESAPKGSVHKARMYADWRRVQAELSGTSGERFEDEIAAAPLTMEGFLKSVGLLDPLKNAQLGVAIAGSTLDPSDDVAANRALVSFWENLIAQHGGSMGVDLLTEAYNALGGARQGARPDMDLSADQQAQIDQLNTRLRVARNEAAINAAFAAVAGGPGDIGIGNFLSGRMAAAGGPMIVVNTLHPGDPKTLQAIGSAAAAGFGYQGYVSSPRTYSGI